MEEKKEKLFKKLLKKEIIISVVVGLLLGLIIMFFVNGGTEAVVSGKFITKGNLYNKMKKHFSINLILDDVDKTILNKKYDLDEEDLDEVKKIAKDNIKQYEMYGYTEETFLKENGFENYDSFVQYLEMEYRRSLYVYDYIEKQLEENAVKKYYDEHAFGKVNTKHILVKISDTMDDAKALALANDIISRLNNGEEFDTLATEYTTNYTGSVITEDLGAMGAFSNLEEAYVNGMKELEIGKFSTTPVKTSYGYHVIYCVDKTEKTEEISNKDKMAIIDTLATEAELELDQTTYYKALIQMRKDAGFKIFDKDFKEKYEEYCAPYVEVEEEEEHDHNHTVEQDETELDVSLNTVE